MSSIAQYLFDKWSGNTYCMKEEYKSKLAVGKWIVEFEKVDGSAAIMECTLDSKLLPPIKEGTVPRPENDDLVHVYSLDRGGWRSFKIAKVKSFYRKAESL